VKVLLPTYYSATGASFIVEQKVFRKILNRLKLWPGDEIRGSPHWQRKGGRSPNVLRRKKHYEPVDDGWLGYEELVYGDD